MKLVGKIMTFDLAASTGYAVGRPGEVPTFGSHRFASTGDNFGRHQANARDWLTRVIFEHDPVMIGYEQPSLFGITTPATVIKLCSYGATLEEICLPEGLNIPVRQINPSQLKKFFTGNGRAKKPEMIAQAKRFGFQVENDDEADAVAMWFMMISYYGDDVDKRQFQQMQFEAGMGVAQKAKF